MAAETAAPLCSCPFTVFCLEDPERLWREEERESEEEDLLDLLEWPEEERSEYLDRLLDLGLPDLLLGVLDRERPLLGLC